MAVNLVTVVVANVEVPVTTNVFVVVEFVTNDVDAMRAEVKVFKNRSVEDPRE